jgi:methyl-accepting chemotaxis protein
MKIMMSLGGLVAGYVFLLGLVLWNTSKIATHIDHSSKNLLPSALSSQEAESDFQKATEHYRDALMQRNSRDLEPADKDMSDAVNSLTELKKLSADDPARQDAIGKMITAIVQLQASAQSIYPDMIAHPNSTTSDTLLDVARLKSKTRELWTALAAMRASTVSDFDGELKGMSVWAGQARTISSSCLAIAVMWAFVSIFLVQKQIVRPIEKLSARLREIAEGDGDLTKRLVVEGTDELGQVAASFNLFMDQLQAILREVATTTIHLASATTEMSADSVRRAQRADRQQQEAEEIAVAMDEMAGSLADVSRSSNSAAEKARHAVALASGGGHAVQEAVARMRVVTDSVGEAGVQIAELGLRSKQIGKIVGLIGDITTQTNLLALNAAIEAARAGEHGRGFAVVAGEVRNLAERTAQATQQIREMIALLQSGTDDAVQTMRHSTAQVQLGMEAATMTGDSLRRIIEAIEQGADMITRVAVATTQQAIGTSGVNENVGRIALLTRDSASGAKKSADASAELATLAIKLQRMISNFRLEAINDPVADELLVRNRRFRLAEI